MVFVLFVRVSGMEWKEKLKARARVKVRLEDGVRTEEDVRRVQS